jgi:hypothetical protein
MPPENDDRNEDNSNLPNDQTTPPAAPKGGEAAASSGKVDKFRSAYEAAQRAVGDPDAPKEAAPKAKAKADEGDKPKPKAKPAEKADDDDDQADAKAKAKAKPAEKAKKAADDDDDGDDDPDGNPPKAPGAKKDEPLAPRRGWSKRRQEDFAYLDRETQAAWLSEPLTPDERWDEATKATFAKMPTEVQDEWLHQSRQLEKGYQGKFEALAGERKMLEEIKTAVPPRVRELMTARKMTEAQVFKTLTELQEYAMNDPAGYVADFIRRGKLDVNDIAERLLGEGQAARPQQLAIEQHPAFRKQQERLEALERQLSDEAKAREEQASSVVTTEVTSAITERDEGGELRYPWGRLLSPYMADLIQDDAESFAGLAPKQVFEKAYRIALDAHPELKRASRNSKPSPDEDDEEQTADAKRQEKVKAAQTVKSKTPNTAPKANGGGSAFSKAYERAERQLASR